ncbi:GGDEF domain-containing protein [Sphingomonas sp. ASV193]|uniref:GGDEF domain-containing protein n=1 Tax=Sphingomonas sp. ASV193 TaxID=3144405 RepID=UPI0032E8ECE7
MSETRILFALIPATFALFATALLVVALSDRRLVAARWGAATFAMAAIGVSLDSLRPPGSNWSLFAVHVAVVACFAKALAARFGQPFPRAAGAMLAAAAVMPTLARIVGAPLDLRHLLFHAAMSGAVAMLLGNCWHWGQRRRVDRLLAGGLAAILSTYLFRLFWLALFPLGDSLAAQPDFFAISTNILFHALIGLSGAIAALLLLMIVGADLMSWQVERARIDALTRVGNRHALADAISDDRSGAWRCGGVVSLDLDHFKAVNDLYGHAIGDRLLQEVGEALRAAIGGAGRLCRTGGEEFVLLVDENDRARLAELARAACETVAAICLDDEAASLKPTASVGYHPRFERDSINDAMRRADLAMYRAKAAGRNRVATLRDPGDARYASAS